MGLFEETNIDIYSSRDQIRNQLIQEAQEYLELETVDLYKTSFVSYLINVLSILSSNQMFYSSTLYREFFLTQAQIQESVYNLAKWIGYSVPPATPSTVNVLFTMPLGFTDSLVNFVIPNDFKVFANDIPFTINTSFVFDAVMNSTTEDDLTDQVNSMVTEGLQVEVLNNRIITVRNPNGFFFPVQISIEEGTEEPIASFLLPFTQVLKQYESFQIPTDLEFYQFYSKRITNIDGEVSDISLYVIPSEIDMTDVNTIDEFEAKFTEDQKTQYLWEQTTDGIYTLDQSDENYVLTTFTNEIEVLFGNGVIGKQPERGSTIAMILSVTKGEEGNVIPGAITTSDTLYFTGDNNKVQRISFDVTNTSSATGGADTPSLAEVKSNAITNLRSKQRLVSETDYDDFNIIVPEVPLTGTIPILKRSDLKVNEITVFSQLIYNNPENPDGQAEIVPTRNISLPIDSTNFFIPRGSSPIGENSEFETIFSMVVDIETGQADYEYILRETDITTALESTDPNYNPLAFMVIPTVNFSSTIDSTNSDIINIDVFANANHVPTDDITQFRAKIITEFDGQEYDMITELDPDDPDIVKGFSYQFLDFLNFPKNQVQFKIRVQGLVPYDKITTEDKIALGIEGDPSEPDQFITISVYTADIIIRQDLSDFMISSVTLDTINNESVYVVHNVPVVLSSYFEQDGFDIKDFELTVLQKLINEININSKRMLTDFINVKFPDTAGKLTNMLNNPVGSPKIISRTLTNIPTTPALFDSYIVNGKEGIDFLGQNWADYKDQIAQWNGIKWIFIEPGFDEFVEIDNKFDANDADQGRKLQWTGEIWFEPVFDIPFEVSLKINKDPSVPISSSALTTNIRTALIDHFSSKFGMDAEIDRSEISRVVRGVDGVKFAVVLKPEVDIRFKFEIKDLEFETLLDYTPQLVAFTEDNISINIIPS